MGTFDNEVTFTGSVTDTSTGLQYMNARYYEPSTGRFLSQDSYTGNAYEPWTQHLYAYCGNNPTNFVDPTGHYSQEILYGMALDEIVNSYQHKKKEVSVNIYLDEQFSDDLSEENVDKVKQGINDWQTSLYDVNTNTTYELVITINIVNDKGSANIILAMNKKWGGMNPCVAGARNETPGELIKWQDNVCQMYLFGDYGRDYSLQARHEFGHVLGLAEAYAETKDGIKYKADPNAPIGSIMRGMRVGAKLFGLTEFQITSHDLGIIFGDYDNYIREER